MKNPVLDPRFVEGADERVLRIIAQTAVESAFADIRAKGPILKRGNVPTRVSSGAKFSFFAFVLSLFSLAVSLWAWWTK